MAISTFTSDPTGFARRTMARSRHRTVSRSVAATRTVLWWPISMGKEIWTS